MTKGLVVPTALSLWCSGFLVSTFCLSITAVSFQTGFVSPNTVEEMATPAGNCINTSSPYP